ncbi:MAG: hypothetical protein IPP88_14080 [Betaproteobacteria bacterium]|nr:hypothetical protein [Betaproteobacteria bacterium]
MAMASGNEVMTAIMLPVHAGLQTALVSGDAGSPPWRKRWRTAMAGGVTDAIIATANTAMGNYFSVNDILHVPPINTSVAGSGAA